ncbi:thioredoxin-like domain-containing protein [Conexibacter sp. SYSU D00693]|uniref:thioredoxin-like domain-containing protein n=1 Tax=Conexibacter sp. SYSU D00693 TaxID=2812560 RepID=UPI00196A626C|nr:thioredoxin-like domain-containing protein [Conexibacter sp. SYSU D00693]
MLDRARVRAPELRGSGGWLGTDGLSLEALRGRVVLLDFWTLACINCLHALEELRGLERRFGPDELVVVGVHSPKFTHEHDHEAVRAAIARHRIEHPVLDDADRTLWDAYGVRAWPTLVLIDATGRVALTVSGEGNAPRLAAGIEQLLQERSGSDPVARSGSDPVASVPGHVASGSEPVARSGSDPVASVPGHVASGSDPVARSGSDPVASELLFPGKVCASPEGARLAVADTGHDRVLELALDGEVLAEHGGLYMPQGVRFDDDGSLLVCETAADLVWRIPAGGGERELVTDAVTSPWDVVRWHGHLVVAEAGRHRLIGIDADGEPQVIAGTAGENIVDGPAYRALLAQPSGLAVTPDGDLAFVDSETSALRLLRRATLDVETLVGQGLFVFGDADGDRDRARLQHPLGVAAAPDGALYVADTFNGLLRVWRGRHLWTVPVEGFTEPGGLDLLPGGRLVVADTGAHRIVVVDPAADPALALALDVGRTVADPVVLAPGAPVPLTGLVLPDDDLDTAMDAPVRLTARSALLAEPVHLALDRLPEALELDLAPGAGRVDLDVELATCTPDACRLRRAHHALDVIVG